MQRYFIILFLLFACQAHLERSNTKKTTHSHELAPQKKDMGARRFDITTVQGANGWGYQIRQNGKLIINQPTIPGRPGTAGFLTQQEAQSVAEFVKSKLLAKVFPPTVSEDDLKNLNIH
jgi:hypothetical protein